MKLFVYAFVWPLVVYASIAYALVLSTGCASIVDTPEQQIVAGKIYRKDLTVCVNGVCREGTIAMPLLPDNVIRIKSPVDMDWFAMRNCAGEKVKPKEIMVQTTKKSFFFWTKTVESKREAEFHYYPTELELTNCPLELIATDKTGKQAQGLVEFQLPNFNLQGEMLCNGERRPFEGVEICQTLKGLTQAIKFDTPVYFMPLPGCEIGETFGTEFLFPANRDACVYQIRSKDRKSIGKLTTFGYEAVFVRD